MNLKVKEYIDQIKKKYNTGHAREHVIVLHQKNCLGITVILL